MIIENPSPYFKAVDIEGNESIIEILNEGVKKESNFKTKDGATQYVYEFNVKLPSGITKIATIKGKSLVWLLSHLGKDSAKWVGKKVSAYAMRKQMIAGKVRDLVFIGFNPLAGDEQEPEGDDMGELPPVQDHEGGE